LEKYESSSISDEGNEDIENEEDIASENDGLGFNSVRIPAINVN
jgi:hypothetical protein